MKIKESLICSQHNNKLSEFTDIESMQDRSDKEFLASNILLFFFKSVFAELAYPCAYWCMRNLTSIQVSTALSVGVTLLHRFEINIRGSICDGTSENIYFIIVFKS